MDGNKKKLNLECETKKDTYDSILQLIDDLYG